MKKIFCTNLLMLLIIGCTTTDPLRTMPNKFMWVDYHLPFEQSMRVFQYGSGYQIKSAIIQVNLPEKVFRNKEKIILVIRVESRTRAPGVSVASFKRVTPYIVLNDSPKRCTYNLGVNDTPAMQTVEIPIKTGHLNVGENTIRASLSWAPNYSCVGQGCGYVIREVSFKNID